jgi:predicted RND superfamily exporter protein
MQMRRWIAATLLAATLAAGWFARDLAVDNRLERWLGERGEAAEGYEAFRSDFGSDEFLLVAIDGGGFFEAPVLDRMLDAAEKLEAIPGVIQVRGIPTFYRDLFGGEDPQALEEELISTPFYRDLFISGDGDLAGILLQVDPGDDRDARSRIVRGAQEAMHPLEMEGRKVSFVGSTALIVALDEASKLEARRTLPVAFVGSLLVLALMLRSVRAMIVTGASALVSVVLTLGFAAVVGLDLNMVSTALPPLLWVLALSNSIHIVRRYQDVRVEMGLPAALRKALADTTRPCTLASVTTAAGFASLAVAVMAPIRELGALAAFGILLSLAVNLTVVPLLIEWLKVPSSRKRPDLRTGTWRWGWKGRPGVVVAGAAVVLAAAIVTIPSIEVESDPVGFLPEDHPTTQAYRSLAGKLGGFYTLELVLTAPDQWFAPSVWPIIQSVADRLAGSAIVSRVLSPVDVLRKLNHWESDFDPAAYRPPATREEAEELVGSASGGARQALRELALDDNRSVRLSALVAEMEENRFLLLEQDAREVLGELPEGWRGVVTGQVLQLVNAQQTLVSTQMRSLGIALCLVFGVMAFGLRSWSLTLTAVLPNLVPLVVAFSLMAALRIPLDAATVMVASIALGIAVDNTVHVLENIRRRGEAGMSTGMAIEETLRDIGPALAATTATACAGFLALCTSDFMPIRAFGLLAAASMTAAFLADVVLLPAILMLRQR